MSRVQCEQYRLYNSVRASAVRAYILHLLRSATNMAPAVSESCQPTFGDVMGDQVISSRSASITVRKAWHGKLRINARLRSTSQCDDHVRCHIDMVLSFY